MSSFSDKIKQNVTNAQSVQDLIRIMQQIPLQSVKTFVLDHTIESMDEDKIQIQKYICQKRNQRILNAESKKIKKYKNLFYIIPGYAAKEFII